ncbi:MAG TPA: trigger factor, partial [Dehalococcoidia bacterium]|nr:trigger factor [Dehalococcoidia bacterium]
MKVSTERIESNQVVLNVEVDPETVEKSLDQAHRRLAGRLNIPGFRRGKAPRAMVERFVGRPALLEEALDRLVPELYQKIVDDEKIDAIAQPTFEITQLEPVTFKATVPVRPDVDLGNYQSLRIELEPSDVDEDEVEDALESLREQQAVWEPVDRPAALGDQVTIDVKGLRDGETVIDQSNLEYPLVENLRVPVPGFAPEIVEMRPGETKEFDVTYTEGGPDEESAEGEAEAPAGQVFHFIVTLHEVKAKRLPELTDEFAHELSEEFATLADLRARITENIGRRKEAERAGQSEERAVDAALELAQVELAPTLIDREIESLLEERERVLAAQRISMQDFLRITQQSEEAMRTELREQAIKRLKRRFVLDEIARREGIEAADDEIDQEIAQARAAEQADETEHAGHRHRHRHRHQHRDQYDRPAFRSALADVIRRRKALQRLVAIATNAESAPAGGDAPVVTAAAPTAGEPPDAAATADLTAA